MRDPLRGKQPRYTDIYPDPNPPINAGVSLLGRSTTGTRTYGAENFYRMWLKAETQKSLVP